MEHGTLYFATRGKMYFQVGESLAGGCVRENQFLWIPPRTQRVCFTDEEGVDFYALLLEETERNQQLSICLLYQELPGTTVVSEPANPAYVKNVLRNAEQQWLQVSAANRIEVNGSALIVIAQWLKSLPDASAIPHLAQKIRPVVEYVMENAARPDLSIAELIRLTPWSRRYFFRAFRAVTGMSPSEYIQHVRINRALSLLAVGGLPINEVARQCGYDDPAYFSRVFTRKVGRPPSRL